VKPPRAAAVLGSAVVLAAAIMFPLLTSNEYILHVAIVVLLYVVLTSSLNLILGYVGQFAVCHAAFYGIGAYTSALLVLKLGMPFWVSWLVAILFTGFWALVIGYPALRLRGAYLAICTFAFAELVRLCLENWDSVTNGTDGIIITYRLEAIPLPFGRQIAFETRTDFYFLALGLAVLTCAIIVAIVRSRIGRVLVAIREDEILVLAAGYNVMHYKVFAFFVSALFAGLAGGFYAPYMTFILPSNYDFDEVIFMIVVTIVGGRATIAGPLIGSAFLVSLPYLLDVNATLRMIAYGAILVVTILYFPEGVVGLLRRPRGPDRRRAGTEGASPFARASNSAPGTRA